MPKVTRYARCYEYVHAYDATHGDAWGLASGHAWDRLHAIASECDRGEYGWTEARRLLDDTLTELLRSE